jgi:hypothetical protein
MKCSKCLRWLGSRATTTTQDMLGETLPKIRSSRLISTRTPVENDSRRKRFASCAMDYFMFDFAPPSECVEGGVLDFSKANEQNTSEHGYSYLQDRGGL